MKDWKTTTAGILTITVGLITFIALPLMQGTPVNVSGFIAVLTPGIVGLLASDSKPAAK